MMDDYINREAALDMCDDDGDRIRIRNIPAADVRSVVRARWEWNNHYGLYECSNCHNSFVDGEWVQEGKWRYCPSCGADMRGASL